MAPGSLMVDAKDCPWELGCLCAAHSLRLSVVCEPEFWHGMQVFPAVAPLKLYLCRVILHLLDLHPCSSAYVLY